MKLVEVVRTVVTAADVVDDVEALCARLGKVDVTIDDRAGFIANALLFGYLNHAVSMFETRYATREDIDAAMKLGCGLPMGPLALLDLIGLDTSYEILDTMYRHGGRDRRHAPTPLIRQMVTAGLLGRKSGRGFYTYEKPGSPKVVPDEQTPAATQPASTGGSAGSEGGPRGRDHGRPGRGRCDRDRSRRGLRQGRLRGALGGRHTEPSAGISETVRASLDEGVARGDLSAADRDAALARITWSATLEQLADVDLVVEAVAEELGGKQALFARLDEICKPGVLLATTTSSLPVIELAMATRRPADVLGLHFPDPTARRPLVEVVRTVHTSAEATATAQAVCAALGRTTVVCGDRAGFVVNALLFPYLNDAVRMLEAGYASVDDIDHAMKLGCGYPVGPFAVLDVGRSGRVARHPAELVPGAA